MNYFAWIFAALLAASLFLRLFFYAKGRKSAGRVFSLLLAPFSLAFFVAMLWERLPDSAHLIGVSSISLAFYEAFLFFEGLGQDFRLRATKALCAFIALEAWNNIYYSAVYLIKIPGWFTSILTIVFIAGFAVFVIIARHKNPVSFVYYAAIFFAAGLLCHSALAELIFFAKPYGSLAFFGGATYLLNLIFRAASPKWILKKHAGMIMNLALLASLLSITASALLMIF